MAAKIDLTFWLTHWNLAPSILLATLLVVGLYLYTLGPYRRRFYPDLPVRRGQTIAFLLGIAIIVLALISPLDELGDDYLFSAHMLQHLCLTTFGPPLLLLGTPAWMLTRLLARRPLLLICQALTWAPAAFLLYNADFLLWHIPSFYNATLENETIHICEHATFLFTGLLSWWPILCPTPRLPRLLPGWQILYIFLMGMPAVLLGAGLTFAQPLYAPYLAAPLVWGISHALDQQLGGLFMWVPVNLFYIVVMSILFLRWMLQQEARQRTAEQQDEPLTQHVRTLS